MTSLPPPPPGSSALPPPPPPRPPAPPLRAPVTAPGPPAPVGVGGAGGGSTDVVPPHPDWQLPGDRWLPVPPGTRPPRPGWVTDPVGWQDVSTPVGDVLVPTRGFGDWWSHVVGALGRSWRSLLALHLVTLPLTLLTAVAARWVPSVEPGAVTARQLVDRLAALVAIALVWLVVSTVLRGASCWAIVHDAAGRPAGWTAAVRFGLRRFWAFAGWSVVTGLATAAGAMACVLPGVYLGVVFGTLLTGVVAFERTGTWRRCFALARGAWWGLLARTLVVAALAVLLAALAGMVSGQLLASSGSDPAWWAAAVVNRVIQLPAEMLAAAMAVVTYAERRAATGRCGTAELVDAVRA